jgi:two-component system phosphate regulon sensor histidine kinase PhoR
MYLFNLKYLLFILLLFIISLLVLAIWLDRRDRRGPLLARLPDTNTLLPILEQAPFGYCILKGLHVHYANATARHLLGLAASAGTLPETIWVPLLTEDRELARQEVASLGRYRHVPLEFNQFIQWWVFPTDDLDIVFVLDVTAQQRAKQTSQFLFSGFSHELRTPIATILTHLEVLSVPNVSDEIKQQSVHLLKQEAQRMTRLVNQMLMLGRLEAEVEIEHRPVNLLNLVDETVFQVTPTAEENNMTISLEADTPLPSIAGDAGRLKQVFLNLLENAIKYAKPGGKITVSLQQAADGIACTVADDGPGIPAEHLPRLTHRFYRADPQNVQGSGLGLAIVTEILRHHRSRLEINSRTQGEQTGTQVHFTLPILAKEEGTS